MKTILVMTDFSDRAEHAANLAVEIAEKTGSNLLLYNLYFLPAVIPAETSVYPFYEEFSVIEKRVVEKLEDAASRLRAKAGTASLEVDYIHRPLILGEHIFENMDRSDTWLIVMGGNVRQGVLSEYLLGSITHDVLEHAFCPVLLVPLTLDHLVPNFRIAFASMMEESDLSVLKQIKTFARAFDADIIVIHVSEPNTSHPESEHMVRLSKAVSRDDPDSLHMTYEDIEGEEVVQALAEFTRAAVIQVLAVVHHRHSLLHELLQRSTTRELLNYTRAMLLVFPAKKS